METRTVTFEARRSARSHGWISFCVNAPGSSRGETITKACVSETEERSSERSRGQRSGSVQHKQLAEIKAAAGPSDGDESVCRNATVHHADRG